MSSTPISLLTDPSYHPVARDASRDVVVEIRDVYGKRKAYPANDKAELLAKIAGTTTLTTRTIELARDLGLTVREKYGRDFWPEA